MRIIVLVCFFLSIVILGFSVDPGVFEFNEHTDDQSERILYSVEGSADCGQIHEGSGNCRVIEITTFDERHRIIVNGELDTQLWETTDSRTGSTLLCKREGNQILVGAEQVIEMDKPLPWYQTLHSLTPFVLGSEYKLRFYTAECQLR